MEVKIDIMLKCYFVHAENDTNITITSRSESHIGRMLLCSIVIHAQKVLRHLFCRFKIPTDHHFFLGSTNPQILSIG